MSLEPVFRRQQPAASLRRHQATASTVLPPVAPLPSRATTIAARRTATTGASTVTLQSNVSLSFLLFFHTHWLFVTLVTLFRVLLCLVMLRFVALCYVKSITFVEAAWPSGHDAGIRVRDPGFNSRPDH